MLEEALTNRRSIRKFLQKAIPRNVIASLIESGTYAPNAGNLQTWRFLVIDRDERLRDMKRIVDRVTGEITGKTIPPDAMTYQNLFSGAPVAIVAIMYPYVSPTDSLLEEGHPERYRIRQERVNPSLQSISSAITQILLAAHGAGLGTCWMTGPLAARPELEEYLSIQYPEEIAAIIALGYPAEVPGTTPPRKPLENILTFLD